MKKFKVEFEVDDDFEKGCCYSCPLHYDWRYEDEDGGDFGESCSMGCDYTNCPLIEIK